MSALLLMTYCLAGQPCVKETVAIFPQWDVGMHMCGIAKPAIEKAVRAKLSGGTRMTMRCEEVEDEEEPEIPRASLDAPKNTTMYNGADDLMRQAEQLMELMRK